MEFQIRPRQAASPTQVSLSGAGSAAQGVRISSDGNRALGRAIRGVTNDFRRASAEEDREIARQKEISESLASRGAAKLNAQELEAFSRDIDTSHTDDIGLFSESLDEGLGEISRRRKASVSLTGERLVAFDSLVDSNIELARDSLIKKFGTDLKSRNINVAKSQYNDSVNEIDSISDIPQAIQIQKEIMIAVGEDKATIDTFEREEPKRLKFEVTKRQVASEDKDKTRGALRYLLSNQGEFTTDQKLELLRLGRGSVALDYNQERQDIGVLRAISKGAESTGLGTYEDQAFDDGMHAIVEDIRDSRDLYEAMGLDTKALMTELAQISVHRAGLIRSNESGKAILASGLQINDEGEKRDLDYHVLNEIMPMFKDPNTSKEDKAAVLVSLARVNDLPKPLRTYFNGLSFDRREDADFVVSVLNVKGADSGLTKRLGLDEELLRRGRMYKEKLEGGNTAQEAYDLTLSDIERGYQSEGQSMKTRLKYPQNFVWNEFVKRITKTENEVGSEEFKAEALELQLTMNPNAFRQFEMNYNDELVLNRGKSPNAALDAAFDKKTFEKVTLGKTQWVEGENAQSAYLGLVPGRVQSDPTRPDNWLNNALRQFLKDNFKGAIKFEDVEVVYDRSFENPHVPGKYGIRLMVDGQALAFGPSMLDKDKQGTLAIFYPNPNESPEMKELAKNAGHGGGFFDRLKAVATDSINPTLGPIYFLGKGIGDAFTTETPEARRTRMQNDPNAIREFKRVLDSIGDGLDPYEGKTLDEIWGAAPKESGGLSREDIEALADEFEASLLPRDQVGQGSGTK